ncbi:hypothetical protein P8452_40630 [Trifolium repens]|nr:hypothetical protein P8452_40630 [Trifolium repens]
MDMANSGIYVRKTKISEICGEDRFLDVIGHVVEKNAMKETEKNGKTNKVMDATIEDLEGNRIHCTLWDDFAIRMQQFLDSHDPSLPVIIILQLCKLKKYLGVMGISNSFYGTKLYLNAELPEVADYIERTAIPKFKIHLQVIDNTGSITFVLFDRVVFQIVGVTAQDLLDGMNNEQNSRSYPPQLEVFINKRMLFKVEVTDANLYRNWRGYTVKKLTDDEDIINRFTSLHGINLNVDDGNVNYGDLISHFNCDTPPGIVEGGDSTTNDQTLLSEMLSTPTSKIAEKKSATKEMEIANDGLDSLDDIEISATKPTGKRSANLDEDDNAISDSNNYTDQITCSTNIEQSNIPNNSGNDLCVVNENNINPLICATNGEECHIPDNYDGDFISNNYISGNEYACSSMRRSNINPRFCSTNEEEYNIPNDTEDDALSNYTYCVSSDEETQMSIETDNCESSDDEAQLSIGTDDGTLSTSTNCESSDDENQVSIGTDSDSTSDFTDHSSDDEELQFTAGNGLGIIHIL